MSGGIEVVEFKGMLVIVLMLFGVKLGFLCKMVLMWVEYEGEYVVVVLLGGVLKYFVWYWNLFKNLYVEL